MARLAIEAKSGSLSGVEERLAAGDAVNQADGVRERLSGCGRDAGMAIDAWGCTLGWARHLDCTA
jgi:hypothetical protein